MAFIPKTLKQGNGQAERSFKVQNYNKLIVHHTLIKNKQTPTKKKGHRMYYKLFSTNK